MFCKRYRDYIFVWLHLILIDTHGDEGVRADVTYFREILNDVQKRHICVFPRWLKCRVDAITIQIEEVKERFFASLVHSILNNNKDDDKEEEDFIPRNINRENKYKWRVKIMFSFS